MKATAADESASRIPAELAEIFREHHRRVFRAAYRITGNAADAEDALQTVFLRLLRRDPDPQAIENPGAYLHRAAVNAALDLLRSRSGRDEGTLEGAAGATADETIELRMWLRQALSQLSPRLAEMFALRYLEGYDNREIAQMLKTSQSVVAVTLHRARSQLKAEFRRLEGGIDE